ncbi:MAG: 4Fe-4S dicluster domain-containing protein [Candidatus Lokiarchaeota archaeon]|nr:4Fe-4S dicluster domain-containing protein [Candidatus Lokiarchaeota archaeon]
MGKRVLLVKQENCKGCHLCELACSSAKEGEFIPSHSRIWVVTNGLKGWSRPIICLQCEDPMCMAVCSAEAIHKTTTSQGDTIISIDKEKCIGCYQCIVACPFGAIEFLKNQKATKCDLCGGSPACVEFCFYDCIKFVELSDEDYQRRLKKIKVLTTKACRELSKQEPYKRRVMFSSDLSKVTDF